MRPRYQEGQIELRSGQWWLRVRDAEGSRKREFLALRSEYPQFRPDSKTDMQKLRAALSSRIGPILARYNQGVSGAAASASRTLSLSVSEFIEQSYYPRLDWRLEQPAGNEFHIEPSTVKGYKDIFKRHVQPSKFGKRKLIDVNETETQRFMESLDQHLSHATHLRVKNFMRGVFSWAVTDGVFRGSRTRKQAVTPRKILARWTNGSARSLSQTLTRIRWKKSQRCSINCLNLPERFARSRHSPD